MYLLIIAPRAKSVATQRAQPFMQRQWDQRVYERKRRARADLADELLGHLKRESARL
jgi:hypothetical protein